MAEKMIAYRRIYFDRLAHGEGIFATSSQIIQTVFKSPEYQRMVTEGFRFRMTHILNYWVGAAFAGGGKGRMWAEVMFEFEQNLTDEERAMLILRDNCDFNPDFEEHSWENPIHTGMGWENGHFLSTPHSLTYDRRRDRFRFPPTNSMI